MDEKGDPSNEEAPKVIKPTSKEFRKTWGFRRTTIAKREGAGDAEPDSVDQQPQQQQQGLSLRRSGRQPKRTERVEEFLTTVRRRGRRTLPVSPEDPGEPASGPATDAETASEGSVESTSDGRGGPGASPAGGKERLAAKAEGGDSEDDTSDSDSDGLTLKELQNRLRRKREQEPADRPPRGALSRLRKKRREEDPAGGASMEAADAGDSSPPGPQEPAAGQAASDGRERVSEGRAAPGEGPRGSGRHKPEGEAYDPSALYCMCRQPHNNRFMICCDRCEEWFHGDCVGISEARGRLLERNGEDYICPNCTILQGQDEPHAEAAGPQGAGLPAADPDGVDCTSMGTVEQKSSEDQGIKGRIEKAANPSGKKKLKIFQPVAEGPAAARCIGPGCSRAAQPDSVYCSSDCILKHAAATMKVLRAGKEARAKPREQAKAKPERLILPKCSVQAGVRVSLHKRPALDKKENAVKKAAGTPARSEAPVQEAPCEASTPSWASDHNYNAVKPEQTAAPRPSLLCKCMYLLGWPLDPSPPLRTAVPWGCPELEVRPRSARPLRGWTHTPRSPRGSPPPAPHKARRPQRRVAPGSGGLVCVCGQARVSIRAVASTAQRSGRACPPLRAEGRSCGRCLSVPSPSAGREPHAAPGHLWAPLPLCVLGLLSANQHHTESRRQPRL